MCACVVCAALGEVAFESADDPHSLFRLRRGGGHEPVEVPLALVNSTAIIQRGPRPLRADKNGYVLLKSGRYTFGKSPPRSNTTVGNQTNTSKTETLEQRNVYTFFEFDGSSGRPGPPGPPGPKKPTTAKCEQTMQTDCGSLRKPQSMCIICMKANHASVVAAGCRSDRQNPLLLKGFREPAGVDEPPRLAHTVRCCSAYDTANYCAGNTPAPSPSPGPAGAKCEAELDKDCKALKTPPSACQICTNAYAPNLQQAGCTANQISNYCSGASPAPPGPTPTPAKCESELKKDCAALQTPPQACTICTTSYAKDLQQAGCSTKDITDYCEPAPAPGPEPEPEPPGRSSCEREMDSDCGILRKPASVCNVCMSANRVNLTKAGCTANETAAYCSGQPMPPPGPTPPGPPPPDAKCQAELSKECAILRTPPSTCKLCTAENANNLTKAGCTANATAAYCEASPPAPPGPPGSRCKTELSTDCGQLKSPPSVCKICTNSYAAKLKAAGCTTVEITAFCTGAATTPPGPPEPEPSSTEPNTVGARARKLMAMGSASGSEFEDLQLREGGAGSPPSPPAPPTPPKCLAALNKDCGQLKTPSSACQICTSAEAADLKTAGCSGQNIAQWCGLPPPPPGPPPGPGPAPPHGSCALEMDKDCASLRVPPNICTICMKANKASITAAGCKPADTEAYCSGHRAPAGPPPTPKCTAELNVDCGALKTPPSACQLCTTSMHGSDLKAAGCTENNIADFCSGDSPPGPRPGPPKPAPLPPLPPMPPPPPPPPSRKPWSFQTDAAYPDPPCKLQLKFVSAIESPAAVLSIRQPAPNLFEKSEEVASRGLSPNSVLRAPTAIFEFFRRSPPLLEVWPSRAPKSVIGHVDIPARRLDFDSCPPLCPLASAAADTLLPSAAALEANVTVVVVNVQSVPTGSNGPSSSGTMRLVTLPSEGVHVAPPVGYGHVRLVNLLNASVAVSVIMPVLPAIGVPSRTVKFPSAAFATASEFIEVQAGQSSLQVQMSGVTDGSSGVYSCNVSVTAGAIYTLLVSVTVTGGNECAVQSLEENTFAGKVAHVRSVHAWASAPPGALGLQLKVSGPPSVEVRSLGTHGVGPSPFSAILPDPHCADHAVLVRVRCRWAAWRTRTSTMTILRCRCTTNRHTHWRWIRTRLARRRMQPGL